MRNIAIALGAIPALLLASACSPIVTPLAYLDYRQCLQIAPDMSEKRVMEIMGEPQSRDERDGELWLYYREESGSSGPIIVVLSNRGGTYVVKDAACDGAG